MRSKYVKIESKLPEGVFIDPRCWYLEIGKRVRIEPLVCIGYPGFGFERTPKGYKKPLTRRPHPYGVCINDDVHIGSHSRVHRGRWRMTYIGHGTKIDSGVHIAHNDWIGRNCIVVAGTVIGGSVTIGNDCFIGETTTSRQGIKIANNVTIGMGSVVLNDIVEPNTTWVGNPARKLYNKQVF
jgi:UDP-3-O-[3-hydroxymyristoyl] glucosamine N-acyltransferase